MASSNFKIRLNINAPDVVSAELRESYAKCAETKTARVVGKSSPVYEYMARLIGNESGFSPLELVGIVVDLAPETDERNREFAVAVIRRTHELMNGEK